MTEFTKVYEAFLARILEDEWQDWMLDEAKEDWRQIMEAAIPWFKFPRIALDRDDDGFTNDLGNEEIQIIANYMKCEWLNRCVLTWENVKPLYEERDFSQANLLEKLISTVKQERENARNLEAVYYRSVNGKSFGYRRLAGNGDS